MTIEDIIREQLVFQTNKNSGWNVLYCEVCGDGSRTQGPRAGWKFEDNKAMFNCFNCGISGSFDPDREYAFSKEMKKILNSFGIPIKDVELLTVDKFLKNESYSIPKKLQLSLKTFDIPDYFYKLSEASENNLIARTAKKFLQEKKAINYESYPFYLSTGITKSNDVREQAIAKTLVNRLIIPAFKNSKIIYYEARSLGEQSKKYINLDIPKSNIIYGYDKLFINYEKPLYICEGFFDSFHLDGIAVLGNKLSNAQIDLISRSPRKKIIVPDKKFNKTTNDNGRKLAEQAIELGWSIALPDIGNCKDITEAIVKYGKLHVLNSINTNIFEGFEADVCLNLW